MVLPLVLLANHPFGIVDGLALCYLAQQRRGAFKILINAVLCRTKRLKPFFLPIDFDETRTAMETNLQSRKDALHTLKEGGTVVVFPAGGVSTAKGYFKPVTDRTYAAGSDVTYFGPVTAVQPT